MTKLTHHHKNTNEFARSRGGVSEDFPLTRREFLRTSVVVLSGALLPRFLTDLKPHALAQDPTTKRIYIAPDDHTDLFWTADLATYERVFVDMLDYYLGLTDTSQNESTNVQSRWNCDGSFWIWTYERKKTQAEFERLIERIRDGHISMPLNALCVCLGGAPAEAVLRGMYYPGQLERRYNLRFPLAYSMENQTLPFGLGALWSGSGATFSWKGICGCATQIPDAWDREHDIYWWVGADGTRLLMKWNSMLVGNQSMGGYAEARYPEDVIHYVDTDEEFKARYPYQVIGAFGYGWDDLQSQTDEFVTSAKNISNQNFKVIVSNEIDFAQDFEQTYGQEIPSVSASFGNEWDLDCASMAEVSARYKRAIEGLRTAESLATFVALKQVNFAQDRVLARDQAWMNMGLFWEHDWQGAPWEGLTEKRIEWTKKITSEIENYVYTLRQDALSSLGSMIQKIGDNERFFVFNPLSWARTDYADYEYMGTEPIHVVELERDQETPHQFVMKDGKRWLRILAENVPSVGYKVFEIRAGEGQSYSSMEVSGEGQIENEYYRVIVDGRGAITKVYDKTRGDRQLAAEIDGRFVNDLGSSAGSLRVEDDGPVCVTLLASAEGPLSHTSAITLFRGVDRIEIQNDITQNFNETHTWGFGFAIQNPNVYHEEVGAILRARLIADGGHYSPRNARYDWLTLNHFVDMNQNEDFGVTVSNADCYFMKVGNSTVRELDTSTPQISVLVGGNDLNGVGALTNQGGDDRFRQRFALQAHDTYNPVSAMKFALEHQNPLLAGKVLGGNSYPDVSFSLITIDDPGVLLWALKPAEDGMQAGVVVRVWNVSNDPSRFFLHWNEGGIISAFSLTHIETPVGLANVEHGILMEFVTPQQLKTYSFLTPQLLDLQNQSGSVFSTVVPQLSGTAIAEMDRSATPAPDSNPTRPSASEGNGCLLGLLGR